MPKKAIEMRARLALSEAFGLDDATMHGDPSWKRLGAAPEGSPVLFPRIEVEQEKSK
jgi:hypothetical protein